MARDYAAIVAALRAKAESTEYEGERAEILAKVAELETEHGPFTEHPPHVGCTHGYAAPFTPQPEPHRPGWYEEWLDSLVGESYLYDE